MSPDSCGVPVKAAVGRCRWEKDYGVGVGDSRRDSPMKSVQVMPKDLEVMGRFCRNVEININNPIKEIKVVTLRE